MMIKALSLRLVNRLVSLLLLSLCIGSLGACGGGTSCPSCLAILLEIPKPTSSPSKESANEQIRLTLTVKNVDSWVIPTTTTGLKKEGKLWLFESTTNTGQNVQVIIADSQEIEEDGKKLLAIKRTQMAFALSESGRNNLRNGGMTLRVLSATADNLRFQMGGALQKDPKPKKEFLFEVKGEWRGEGGECLDSFKVSTDVFFNEQGSATTQKAAWAGSCQ